MAKTLKASDVNHLRRLLGWVRCEIPPDPAEVVSIVQSIAPAIETEDAKQKMLEWHRESESVPKYIRAALKALAKAIADQPGETVDGENVSASRIEHKPLPLPSPSETERHEP